MENMKNRTKQVRRCKGVIYVRLTTKTFREHKNLFQIKKKEQIQLNFIVKNRLCYPDELYQTFSTGSYKEKRKKHHVALPYTDERAKGKNKNIWRRLHRYSSSTALEMGFFLIRIFQSDTGLRKEQEKKKNEQKKICSYHFLIYRRQQLRIVLREITRIKRKLVHCNMSQLHTNSFS